MRWLPGITGTLTVLSGLFAPAAHAAPPVAPILVAPSGLVPGTTQGFTWQAASGATWYQLWINDAVAAPKVTQWYTAQQANCAEGTGACTVAVSPGLSAGAGRWFVAAWNSDGTTWSAGMDFTVRWVAGGWEQALPGGDRFQLVLGGAGVLDRETGLVVVMRAWSGWFFIPEMLAFQKIPPDSAPSADLSARVSRWTFWSWFREPLDLITLLFSLLALSSLKR